MDFTMKDFDSVAMHTATGDTVNVQHKKPFDIADVDNNEMKLEVIFSMHGYKKRLTHICIYIVCALFHCIHIYALKS